VSIGRVSFYGDESGSHGDGPFVLSGYLGSDVVWSDLETAWHDVLHDPSIGGHEIDYFHMRECFKLEKQFARFNRWQADKKMNALVEILCHYLKKDKLLEYTAVLDWDIYRGAVDGPLKTVYHNPYLLAFGAVMTEIGKYVKTATETATTREPVYFFLDDQIALVETDVNKYFHFTKATLPEEYSGLFDGVTFRSDQYCYPLQAGDLIAWQRHRRELDLPEDCGPRPEYKRLHKAAADKGLLLYFREDGLVEFSQRTDARLRAKGLI
jgi:hypothetical protein